MTGIFRIEIVNAALPRGLDLRGVESQPRGFPVCFTGCSCSHEYPGLYPRVPWSLTTGLQNHPAKRSKWVS